VPETPEQDPLTVTESSWGQLSSSAHPKSLHLSVISELQFTLPDVGWS